MHTCLKSHSRRIFTSFIAVAALGVACDDGGDPPPAKERAVHGAGYSTFDKDIQGCLDSPNGVDCNNYESKDAVFMSGGPSGGGGLSDGEYFFAVLAPGYQNGGFLDGAQGNLSDTTAGGTTGDRGGGDEVSNRTFRVQGGAIVEYAGTHAWGESPQGKKILQLKPFDDTDNEGGVYILAICQVDAVAPNDCKYDAFRIKQAEPTKPGVVSGGKYYDANTNGMRDEGEPGLASWMIDYSAGEITRILTEADGTFRLELPADTYTFAEVMPSYTPAWRQTGNLIDQTTTTGGAIATLNWDMSYTVAVVDGSEVSGLWFGNVCLGSGGGRTLGFWSNKNGALLTSANDLMMLSALNLRSADGSDFDPAGHMALAAWLLAAKATNMANMLSAQLAAMAMNVAEGFVSGGALVYAPGSRTANANGFTTVQALVDEADASLALHANTPSGHAERAYQEALKNALDNANNNRTFVQPTPATCPAPLFVAPELPV